MRATELSEIEVGVIAGTRRAVTINYAAGMSRGDGLVVPCRFGYTRR